MLKLGAQVCFRTLVSNFIKSPVVDVVKKENAVLLNAQLARKTSFFNRCTKEQLWKGILSVSNAGKRKGRGRNKDVLGKKVSRYEKIDGEGNIRVTWPGLNTNVLKGNKLTEIKPLPPKEKTDALPIEVKTKRHLRIHPFDRGWSGRSALGRKIGPPKPFFEQTFEGFESIVLEHKHRSIMTSVFGRKRKFLSIVATGNGNGLIGLAAVETFNGKIGIQLAQKKASKKLIHIDLIEKHTVNHDFCSENEKTRVIVFKRPKGSGLQCHRVITALCKLIGIEDLSAKVEGSCNVSNIIRAFIKGLLAQKTYQQIADEKNLHLVEFKEESHNFPLVLASPKQCLTLKETREKPITFEEYIMGNRLLLRKEKEVPFYQKLPSWRKHLIRTLFCRNHKKVKIDILAKYDEYRSHLTEVYPECVGIAAKKEIRDNSE